MNIQAVGREWRELDPSLQYEDVLEERTEDHSWWEEELMLPLGSGWESPALQPPLPSQRSIPVRW